MTVFEQYTLFETPIAQDLPRQLDQVYGPELLDVGFWSNLFNHHPRDHLELLSIFAGQQKARF
ncbi:MAG TPA: hypothetical protein VF396_17160, partial [Bradyrhizobium sp.]